MSWRSLFAFNNPTGLIGSTYNANVSTILAGEDVQAVQNIATFSYLPVGVYSIAVTASILSNVPIAPIIINNWIIGAGATFLTSVLFPFTNIIPIQTEYTASSASTSSVSANFIISVTNSNPIYINSYFTSTTSNQAIKFSNPSVINCIATKIA